MTAAAPRHRKPPLWRRILARLHFPAARPARHDLDAARTLAWVSRVEGRRKISPATAAQIQAHVCGRLIQHLQPLTRPAPLPCEPLYPPQGDPRWPHLNAGQLGDTGTFTADIDQLGGER